MTTGDLPICEELFQNIITFYSHKALHSGGLSLKCEICQKSFSFGNDLVQHTAIHIGIKPQSRKRCGLGFIRQDALRTHQIFH